MIISENVWNLFFEEKICLRQAANTLNKAGIINTYLEQENIIKVETPTIRPDLNSILGIVVEYAALANIKMKCNLLKVERRAYETLKIQSNIPVIIGKIQKSRLELKNLDIRRILEQNQLVGLDIYQQFVNFCALFFGIPPILIPWNQAVDGVSIEKRGNTYEIVAGQKRQLWGEPSEVCEEEELCMVTLLVNPVETKKFLEQQGKHRDGLYYYYIRRGNSCFLRAMFKFVGATDIADRNCRKRKGLLFKQEEISRILGWNVDEALILKILERLGYQIEKNVLLLPEWRSDIKGIQEIANDVMRFLMLKEKLWEKHSLDNQDYAREYRRIIRIKQYFADNGFREVMTRPFIEESEFKQIQRYYENNIEAVKIENPLNKEKNIFLPSLLTKCMQNLAHDDRIFEISKVKRKQENHILETDVLGVGGRYSSGEEVYSLLNFVYKYAEKIGVRMEEKTIGDTEYIWRLYSGNEIVGTMYIKDEGRKHVVILLEIALLYLYPFDFFNEYFMQENGRGVFRELSIDLPIDCSFIRLMECDSIKKSGIDRIILKRITLYKQEKIWKMNYVIRIYFGEMRKKDIPQFNQGLMLDVKHLSEEK